jgi:DNA repair protein RadC
VTLSDAELLAALIRDRHGAAAALKLAGELLSRWGSLAALPAATEAMLRGQGLCEKQAVALLAASELACRLARGQIPDREPLARLDQVARYLALRYQRRDQEVMGALYLDLRHRLMGDAEIYRGVLNGARAEPREILKECLLHGAAAVLIFHTHPSGDPTPSYEDVRFSRRLAEAGEIVGVELVDHLVLGKAGRYVSLKRRGLW